MATVTGLKESIKNMGKRADIFSGKNPVLFTDLGNIIAGSIRQNFDSQGRPRWTPRNYGKWPILDYTGLMRDTSEQSAHNWRHQGGTHTLDILTTPYSVYHQYPSKIVPLRPFVRLSGTEYKQIYERFSKAFHEVK